MISTDLESIIIIFITSGALSFVSAPLFSCLFIPIAYKIGAIDVKNDGRRMHREPMARIGGCAVFAAMAVGIILFLTFCRELFMGDELKTAAVLLLGGLFITLGGLLDDIYTLSPAQKLLLQLGAATLCVIGGIRAPLFALQGRLSPLFEEVLSSVGAALWCVLLTNAFNLIDGLDGLCGSSASFSFMALLMIGRWQELIILYPLCATLGFLPLNLRPAKLFLGDSGAMLLGYTLSVISMSVFENIEAPLSFGLIFALPLFDTAFAVCRRILKGKNPFLPDREHLHHKLVDAGVPHGAASILLALLGGGAAALGVTWAIEGATALSLISIMLLIFSAASVIMIINKSPRREKKQ